MSGGGSKSIFHFFLLLYNITKHIYIYIHIKIVYWLLCTAGWMCVRACIFLFVWPCAFLFIYIFLPIRDFLLVRWPDA